MIDEALRYYPPRYYSADAPIEWVLPAPEAQRRARIRSYRPTWSTTQIAGSLGECLDYMLEWWGSWR